MNRVSSTTITVHTNSFQSLNNNYYNASLFVLVLAVLSAMAAVHYTRLHFHRTSRNQTGSAPPDESWLPGRAVINWFLFRLRIAVSRL
jgi:hypothetical protein